MTDKADAILRLIETHAELQKCKDSCEYDHGYFCHYQHEAYEKACKQLEDAFKCNCQCGEKA